MTTPDEVRAHYIETGHELGWGPDDCAPCRPAREEIREARKVYASAAARRGRARAGAMRWATSSKKAKA